jgi:hypothetical protein
MSPPSSRSRNKPNKKLADWFLFTSFWFLDLLLYGVTSQTRLVFFLTRIMLIINLGLLSLAGVRYFISLGNRSVTQCMYVGEKGKR